jgi:hypothetical protein
MLKLSGLALVAVCAAAVSTAGCYVETAPVAPAAPVAEGDVVVDPPPPPPPVAEAPPAAAPAPGMVWVNGAHRWDGHAYVWEKGHYDRPPRPEARFVQGHWEARGRGKVWVNGHWG